MGASKGLLARIAVVLVSAPGSTAREIAMSLGEHKSTINSALYSRSDLFFRSTDSRPRWWLQSSQPTGQAPAFGLHGVRDDQELEGEAAGDGLRLFAWQERALEAWAAHGFRGVVEAVTGSGKTRIGLAAAERHLRAGGK